MPYHGFYVRMLDVCVTLACIMEWYAYRARLDARQGLRSIMYASYEYLFYAYRVRLDGCMV